MRRMTRFAALLLAAALFLPGRPAPAARAAAEETVLYHREASAVLSENTAAWVGNSNSRFLQTCATGHMGTLRAMCWYNNRTESGTGLPEGETMRITIPNLSIPTAGWGEVTLSLTYVHCPGNTDIAMGPTPTFQVFASTDGGQTWSADFAGLRSRARVDSGVTSNNLAAQIYELESEDLACLVPGGAVINALLLRPYGDWLYHYGATRICRIDVTGRTQAAEKQWISVDEADMRALVVARAHRTASLPWTCGEAIVTRWVASDDEKYAIRFPAGAPCQGPVYNRQHFTTWERFRSSVDGEGNYTGGTDYTSAEGMDCNRFVLDALSAVCTSYRGNWPILMWDPTRVMLGELQTERWQYTNEVVANNTAQALYESYALLQPGDYCTRFFPNGNEDAVDEYQWHIRLASRPSTVVRKADGTIDPYKSYAYCDEISNSIECFYRTPEGQTVTWTGRDPAAYQAEHPGYELTMCRSCRVDKPYSFYELKGYNYTVFTLPEYAAERLRGVETRTVFYGDGDTARTDGFDPIYNSNWRICSLETRLVNEDTGAVLWEETRCPEPATYFLLYRNTELNGVLQALPTGRYRLTADMVSGPVTQVDGEPPVTRVMDLSVSLPPRGDLTGDFKINGKDVVMFQRYVAGGYDVTLDPDRADLNGDGKLSGKDAVILQRYVAGGYGVELN